MTIKKGLPLILGIAATVVVLTLCGMQRFLHAFMHGNFLEAIQYNYMLIVLIPYLLLFGIERFILIGERKKRWNSIIEGRVISTIMIILAPSWFIIRNILHI